MNKEINALETANHRLEFQIAQRSSLSRVEQLASSKLGMQKAEMTNSLAMEIKPEPVQVADNSVNSTSKSVSQKPLLKIYNSLSRLAQNI